MTTTTNPITEGYYIVPTNDSYSTLIQQQVRTQNNNYFILNTPYCIQKITIPNPYKISYWLYLSGFTFPNFTYDATTQTSSFDVNDYASIIPHVGDEIYLDNKTKFPRIQIMYPPNNSTVYYKNDIDINIQGFEILDSGEIPERIPINTNVTKYLTTYSLPMNAPTDSIDFYGTLSRSNSNNNTNTANISLSLNNKVYNSVTVNSSSNNKLIRFKLDNTSGTFALGNENNYLPSNINADTINLTPVVNIDIEFNGFIVSKINQNVYTAYSYPERDPLFTYSNSSQ